MNWIMNWIIGFLIGSAAWWILFLIMHGKPRIEDVDDADE